MKINKKIGLIVFIMMLALSIVSIDSVFAKDKGFSLKKAEIGEKSSTVTVNKFSYKGDTITSDVTFHKVGDYVTYKLVVKNASDKTLTISSITDTNKDKNVTYSYDQNKGVKIKAGNTLTLLVKAKYAKGETDTSKRTKKLSAKFTINYKDSSSPSSSSKSKSSSGSSSISINPSTGDKIMLFAGILLGSVIALLVIVDKKKKLNKKKVVAYLMILSILLPIGVSAAASAYEMSFASTYKLMDKVIVTIDVDGTKTKKVLDYNTKLTGVSDPEKAGMKFVGWATSDGKAFDMSKPITKDVTIKAKFEEGITYLQTGKKVREKLEIANGCTDLSWVTRQNPDRVQLSNNYCAGTYRVEHIKFVGEEQYNAVKDTLTEDNIISADDSAYPVYLWSVETGEEYGEKTGDIYYYSEADKIYMNEDSSYMFSDHYAISIDLSKLDTSLVTDMSFMFSGDSNVGYYGGDDYLDLSNFNTSNVTNMKGMFDSAQWLNMSGALDLSSFDTSKVTDMSYMFHDVRYIAQLDVSSFDTSKVTTMRYMFSEAGDANMTFLDLSSFDTSNVTDMYAMFASNVGALQSIKGISNFKTAKVTNMGSMFAGTHLRSSLDLSSWDTSQVTNMAHMFRSVPATINITGFDSSKVTNMNNMFNGTRNLIGLEDLDTSLVTNMDSMFANSIYTTLDISTFNTSSLTTAKYMFSNCQYLETIYANNNFVAPTGEDTTTQMFYKSTRLVGGAGTAYNASNIDGSYARIDDPDNGTPGYFTQK